MKQNFDLPQTIGAWGSKDYKPNNFTPVTPGYFTAVKGLDVLPPSFVEHLPDLDNKKSGFVIKRYRDERIKYLFNDDDCPLFLNKEDSGNYSLVDTSRLLEERQKMLLDYLGDDKDLILTSYFLVDVDEKKNPSLYEIQERVPDQFGLDNIHYSADSFDREKLQRLVDNLEKLVRVIERMIEDNEHPYFSKYIPDWNDKNLFITPDGEIRIFDSNSFDKKDSVGSSKKIMMLRRQVRDLVKSIKSSPLYR